MEMEQKFENFCYVKVVLLLSAVKCTLMSAYHSTDFEVHRNWMAITHSLPVSKWYKDETSEWTLDYPPLFAWFEYLLSHIARFFDPSMLKLTNLNYASYHCVLFQRSTVILTDLVYIYAAKEFCKKCIGNGEKLTENQKQQAYTLFFLLVGNFGLFIIDHIHFQYNGFLFGLLLLSIVCISQRKHVQAAIWFTILLNFKHIYLYMAPAYFIYLLRNYCFTANNKDGKVRWSSFSILRLFNLGLTVIFVFFVSFGPFIYLGQLEQVLSRLFPFKRGLCHAYWAPNFWALYNLMDKVVTIIGVKTNVLERSDVASMTGGLVQEFNHTALPSIQPLTTFILTIVAIIPCLFHLWKYPAGPRAFIRTLVFCAYSSYMFGWHVHEKAVLLMIIPLSLVAIQKKKDAEIYFFLSTVGHYSLFPLIFTEAETLLKYLFMAVVVIFTSINLPKCVGGTSLTSEVERFYLVGLIPLELYCNLGHFILGFHTHLAFLPLLLRSVYCAIGVTYTWIKLYRHILSDRSPRLVKSD